MQNIGRQDSFCLCLHQLYLILIALHIIQQGTLLTCKRVICVGRLLANGCHHTSHLYQFPYLSNILFWKEVDKVFPKIHYGVSGLEQEVGSFPFVLMPPECYGECLHNQK